VRTGQTEESILAGLCLPTRYTGCRHAEDVFFDDRNLWQVTSLDEPSAGSSSSTTAQTRSISRTIRVAIWSRRGVTPHILRRSNGNRR
jgi:hypothetical protein